MVVNGNKMGIPKPDVIEKHEGHGNLITMKKIQFFYFILFFMVISIWKSAHVHLDVEKNGNKTTM